MPNPTPETDAKTLPNGAYFSATTRPTVANLTKMLNDGGFSNVVTSGLGQFVSSLAISPMRTGPFASIAPTSVPPSQKPSYDTSSWLQITLGSVGGIRTG